MISVPRRRIASRVLASAVLSLSLVQQIIVDAAQIRARSAARRSLFFIFIVNNFLLIRYCIGEIIFRPLRFYFPFRPKK